RIVAVADVFDALSTNRPYRPGFPLEKCGEILEDSAEKGDLDPDLVGALLNILGQGAAVLQPVTS
ncbi:MAG: two-component system response regulator, partial [Planctomycetes bacterium]|nr:two-component system response regulator [Planctomycetota bacterium]